jgi:predicted TIM-barrel fold metal-dependent hydrolase
MAASSPSLAPPAGPARADTHCHIFNIRDVPAYAFIVDVVLENDFLRNIGAPLARLIVEICRAPAPTYDDEKRILNALIAPRSPSAVEAAPDIDAMLPATRSAAEPAQDVDAILMDGLRRYVEGYTSFNSTGMWQGWTKDYDFLITEDLFRPLLGLEIDLARPPVENASIILDHLPDLVRSLRRYHANKLVATRASTLSYIVHFIFYWAPELAKYRYKIAEDLAGLYGSSTTPVFLAPTTLDITAWLKDAAADVPPTDLEKQSDLMSLISLVQPPNRAMHGFVGFDPWRYAVDLKTGRSPTALDIVKKAVEQQGFVGVKIYPPMGFQAIGNAHLPDSAFPNLSEPYTGKGKMLDDALIALYDYCSACAVPIMAHCALSQSPAGALPESAHPRHWGTLLEMNATYKSRLRVNLGHFGGVWGFDGTHVCWTKEVAEVIQTGRYEYLYTDFGDFANILDRGNSDNTRRILDKVKHLVDSNRKVRERVLYGTDFMLLGREPGFERFYSMMSRSMADALGVSDLAGFMCDNAVRFLGLAPGEQTRTRLEAFYTQYGQDPRKLVQFGG